MKKSLFCVVLISVLIAVFLSPSFGQEKKTVLRLGHIRDTDHPTHQAALKFKKDLEEKSKGAFEVKIFPNSQLGDPKAMFVGLVANSLEMVYGGINTMGWIKGGEVFRASGLPFFYRDYDHMRKCFQSNYFKPILDRSEKNTGIKIVNMNGDSAPRGLTTKNKPIKNVDDMKGLKIRIAASPAALATWKALGTMPQVIALADLYMALKTGVVEAQENGAIVVATSSYYEVQSYYSKIDWARDIETFYMGMNFWNQLPADKQKLIFEASEGAGNLETELTQAKLTSVYEFLKSKKMTVIENPDVESMRQKWLASDAIKTYEVPEWPKDLVEQFKNIK